MDPPAESMAAVDPAAVETLKPLDRQLTKELHDWLLSLSLPQKEHNHITQNQINSVILVPLNPKLKA